MFDALHHGLHNPYDEYGVQYDDEPLLTEKDLNFPLPLINLTNDYLNMPFDLVEGDRIPSDTIKALNAHHVTALNIHKADIPRGADICVLATGNGEDFNRLVTDGISDLSTITSVGTTDLNARATRSLALLGGRQYLHREFLHDAPEEIFLRQYDVILCHHGLHHIMRTDAGVRSFVRLLTCLKPGGFFIGDKIDMMGLDTLEKFSHLPSHSVELINVDRTKGIEGCVTLRVARRTWEDPILSDRRLLDTIPPGFAVHLLQGRGAFSGATLSGKPFLPPSHVRTAARRAETRVVTHIEIRRSLTPVPPSVLPSLPASWEPALKLPNHVPQYFEFPVVKGKHFHPRDIPYLGDRGSTIFSEKTDGVSCRVVVGEGAAYARIETSPPRFMIASLGNRSGLPILRLHCEWVGDFPVLLDPISLGIDTPSGFLSRLNHYNSLVRATPQLSSIIRTKEWRDAPDPAWDEGIVMVGVSTPPPTRGLLYRDAARYIKRRPTIDIARGGKIVEVDAITESFVRDRPDKTSPNSARNIRDVKEAVPHGVFLAIWDLVYDPGAEVIAFLENPLPTTTFLVGHLISLKYPNRPNLDPHTNTHKTAFLHEIGFSPPQSFPRNLDHENWDVDLYDV